MHFVWNQLIMGGVVVGWWIIFTYSSTWVKCLEKSCVNTVPKALDASETITLKSNIFEGFIEFYPMKIISFGRDESSILNVVWSPRRSNIEGSVRFQFQSVSWYGALDIIDSLPRLVLILADR